MCCLPLVHIHDIHSLDILPITGPGYLASGWYGDNRYETTEMTKAETYVLKAMMTAVTVFEKCGIKSEDRRVGAATSKPR